MYKPSCFLRFNKGNSSQDDESPWGQQQWRFIITSLTLREHRETDRQTDRQTERCSCRINMGCGLHTATTNQQPSREKVGEINVQNSLFFCLQISCQCPHWPNPSTSKREREPTDAVYKGQPPRPQKEWGKNREQIQVVNIR